MFLQYDFSKVAYGRVLVINEIELGTTVRPSTLVHT